MMTCRQLTELVTDYYEGRLSFLARIRFQLHLGLCIHCRRYVRQIWLTIKTLGGLPPEAVPDATRQELLERFRRFSAARPGSYPHS